MMSGDHASSNPFRRKPQAAGVPPIKEHEGSDFDRPSSLQQDSRKPPARKQVRIKTPPSRYEAWSQSIPSSPDQRRSSPDRYSLSTATDSSTSSEASPVDSTHHVSDQEEEGPEDEELLQNTRRNSFTSAPGSQSTQGPPINPFSKTLATLEGSPTARMDHSKTASPSRPILSGKQDLGATKPSLDVDSFKRLLLTGTASQSTITQILASAPAQLHMQPGIPGDSGSSTDTSSISRQSIFEQTPETSHNTPMSSHDISPSENERRRSWTESPPSVERKKPPPPKSRHGKLLENQGPQTVSFDDPSAFSFTATIPSPRPGPSSFDPLGTPNKALPAPPIAHLSRQESAAQGANPGEESEVPLQQPPASHSMQQKRVPPPPPLARRHSQLKSGNASSQSGHSARPTKDEQSSLATFEEQSTSPSKNPPPPPPPRHHGLIRNETPPSNPPTFSEGPTISTDLSPPESAIISPTPTPSAPPPPPSRTPSISSLKRPSRASPNSAAQGGMAPPPPPPRNRGSSQSSLEYPRLTGSNRASGEFRRPSSESQRRPSGSSSLSRTPGVVEENPDAGEEGKVAGANDILGDLEALQRDVDALRGKYATVNGG